ncbi:hypothetical protein ACOMHN_059643 [Nucella lapillus]
MTSTVFNKSISTTEFSIIPDHNVVNITENDASSPCVVLKVEGVVPWDNPDSLISADTEDMVHRVKYTVILPLLFLIGGPANVINMAVFYKQGLRERINVCLFSLSLVDFLYLFFNLLFYAEQACLQLTTQFTIKEKYGPLMRFMINHSLLSFFGLPWVSQIISALIASERCFCVLWPLRSQTVLSAKTTTVVIVVSSVITLSVHFLVMTMYQAVCAHDPLTNDDIWTLTPSQFFLDHQELINTLNAYVFGVGIPGVVITVVTVTTTVTVVKLHQAAVWRASTSSSGGLSAREVGATIMLVYNSIFFVICVFPSTVYRTVDLYVPELGVGRQQHNLSMLCNWILDTLTYINATFNILIYYTMGSRYRQTLSLIVGRAGSSKTGRKGNHNADLPVSSKKQNGCHCFAF